MFKYFNLLLIGIIIQGLDPLNDSILHNMKHTLFDMTLVRREEITGRWLSLGRI